jgi:N-acetylmuramoyl-L-alanine amidase
VVRPSVVVLDPGHGGRDTGAIGGGGLLEKTVALDLARRVERKLRGSGLKVRLTRKRDRTVDLRTRTTLAAKWGGGLFVSVHLNASVNRSAAGIETYALAVPGLPSTASDSGDPTPFPGHAHNGGNIFLAYCLHRALLSGTGAADRGIRRARFQVLREAPCPAALVECGFVSNRIEESRLATAVFRDEIAEAIARGIRAYVSRTAP